MGIKRVVVVLSCGFIISAFGGELWADTFLFPGCSRSSNYQQCRQYLHKPMTKTQIKKAYHLLVHKEDGISPLEARLMAQFNVIQREDFESFHIGRPKIVLEDELMYQVRIPGKYSFSKGSVEHFLIKIDKSSGEIVY